MTGRRAHLVARLSIAVLVVLSATVGAATLSSAAPSRQEVEQAKARLEALNQELSQLVEKGHEAQARLGTIFHEARSGPGAERVKRLAFRPASGYAFPVVQGQSWHSVAQTSDADGERNSLMLTYYVQEHPPDWVAERVKRAGLFLAYPFRR